jgi:hypothetical protein
LGREVEVNVESAIGDTKTMVMSAKGDLRRWHQAKRVEVALGRDDIEGLYDVSGASLDVTDLSSARPLADDEEQPYGLEFDVAEGTVLTVVWGVEV